MKRREFLKIAGGGMALSPWLQPWGIAADGSAATGVLGNRTDTGEMQTEFVKL